MYRKTREVRCSIRYKCFLGLAAHPFLTYLHLIKFRVEATLAAVFGLFLLKQGKTRAHAIETAYKSYVLFVTFPRKITLFFSHR